MLTGAPGRRAMLVAAGALALGFAAGWWLSPRLRPPASAFARIVRVRAAALDAQIRQVGAPYILRVGDSHTERAYVPALCGRPTLSFGFGGAGTRDVMEAVSPLVPATTPDAIVLGIGTNDVLAAGGADDVPGFTRDVAALVERLRAISPRIVVTDMPSVRPAKPTVPAGAVARHNAALAGLCAAGRCRFVPVYGTPETDDLLPDGVHLADYRTAFARAEPRLCAAVAP